MGVPARHRLAALVAGTTAPSVFDANTGFRSRRIEYRANGRPRIDLPAKDPAELFESWHLQDLFGGSMPEPILSNGAFSEVFFSHIRTTRRSDLTSLVHRQPFSFREATAFFFSVSSHFAARKDCCESAWRQISLNSGRQVLSTVGMVRNSVVFRNCMGCRGSKWLAFSASVPDC